MQDLEKKSVSAIKNSSINGSIAQGKGEVKVISNPSVWEDDETNLPTKFEHCNSNSLRGMNLTSRVDAWAETRVGWLCWGLTSQSTIFQSCRDGAIASWVINQYFRGVKCLAQEHNTAEVGLEPRTSRSGVRHSTTEPPRSPGDKSGSERHSKGWTDRKWTPLSWC